MTKRIIIICLFLIYFNIITRSQDVYQNRIDSLLVSIGRSIAKDISESGIKVLDRPWIGFGESFELEVIFDSKHSALLTFFNRPNGFSKHKHSIKKVTPHIKYLMFYNFITDNNELPYKMFESFNYKFLLLERKGETFGDALFGEYRFKAAYDVLTIIDKKIEILKGDSTILKKNNSNW